jgi:hypothetical protein
MRVAGASLVLLLVACGPYQTPHEPGPETPIVDYVRTQETLTPLPLRVSLPRKMGAEHVIVLFKPFGVRGWKQVELPRRGESQTWAGEVSCREVSTVLGKTKYFVLALDENGDVVGGSGSPDWPHLATIVDKLPEGAQSIEGERKPLRCHDVADCPPAFPGCPAYHMKRNACTSSTQCVCAWDGYCGSPSSTDTDPTAVENLDVAIRSVRKRFQIQARAR